MPGDPLTGLGKPLPKFPDKILDSSRHVIGDPNTPNCKLRRLLRQIIPCVKSIISAIPEIKSMGQPPSVPRIGRLIRVDKTLLPMELLA